MCWRCDEPEEELHDAHFWTARATLHQRHVAEWQTERMDQYLGQFGMKRVDMSKIKLTPASEIAVQPMMPPMKLGFTSSWPETQLHNWHCVLYENNRMLKLIKGGRYQQVLAGREDGTP